MSHSTLRTRPALTVAALALLSLATAGCNGPTSLAPPNGGASGAGSNAAAVKAATYNFKTIDNQDDPTFNELLGINNLGKLAGFYGDGEKAHPSVGYVIRNYGQSKYLLEDCPGASNTRVTAVNNQNVIAGYYDRLNGGGTFGFIEHDGIWASYKDPHTHGDYNVTKLLGLADSGLAVGYYEDADKNDHAFELIQASEEYHAVTPPGAVSTVATGINGKGDIVGYFKKQDGSIESFLLKGGIFTEFTYAGSDNQTEATSINWQDEIAGYYVDAGGSTHGFVLDGLLNKPVWTAPIDDPKAPKKTVVEGIQNHHYIVGYYVDAAGDTNGFLAEPAK